jgi:small-conductance mechanosensitive channel
MKTKEEIEIERKDVYLKLEPYDSIDIKKALLEIEASSINMQLISEKLKERTRQELRERSAAKRQMKDASNMIYELIQRLPKAKEIPTSFKKQIFEEKEIKQAKSELPKKEAGYNKQLEELRKRIAGLQ